MECPICLNLFPEKVIEIHASSCGVDPLPRLSQNVTTDLVEIAPTRSTSSSSSSSLTSSSSSTSSLAKSLSASELLRQTANQRKQHRAVQSTIPFKKVNEVKESSSKVDLEKPSKKRKKSQEKLDEQPIQKKLLLSPSASPSTDLKTEKKKKHTLKFITWNIWFGRKNDEKRLAAIGHVICEEQPDFIALQEVRPDMLPILESQVWHHQYDRSLVDEANEYFTLLYSKIKPLQMKRIPFNNSVMGRDITIASVPIKVHGNEVRFSVATSHLESGHSFKSRRQVQLTAALQLLTTEKQGTTEAVYMGDMNLREKESMDVIKENKWIDAWKHCYPKKTGHTMDSTLNPMVITKTKNGYRHRFDRLFCRFTYYQIAEVRLLGTQPVRQMLGDITIPEDLYCSDHFGLCMNLTLKKAYDQQ